MNLTPTHLEALYAAKVCALEGNAFVPHDDDAIFCEHLARHGWLIAEPQDNGDTAYAWSAQAETALGLRALMDDAQGRTN
jgi:hypothetical protein